MDNKKLDPNPWFRMFKSARLIPPPFLNLVHHSLSTFAKGDYPREVSPLDMVQIYQDTVVQGCRHKDPLFPDRAEHENTELLASLLAEL